MRLGIIVSEFPKTTETFILRDLLHFSSRGHQLCIHHISPYRKNEVVHEFARPILAWSRSYPFLFGWTVLDALLTAISRYPVRVVRIIMEIIWAFKFEPIMLAKSLIMIPKCIAIARQLEEWKADHVHAEFAGYPATCAWITSRLNGLPYSVSCRAHDIFRTQSLLATKLSEATFVRTISKFNQQFLRKRIPTLQDQIFSVIHSSLDTKLIQPLPPAQNNHFHILYVGALEPKKGVDTLFNALALLQKTLGSWHCELIGSGPESYRLKRMAQDLGLTDQLSFKGSQPFEEVCAAHQRADVLVAPSRIAADGRMEGIPNVVIEALAHQRPVVTTKLSGIPELIKNHETGLLVEPDNPEELANALLYVFTHPDEAATYAEAGRKKIEQEFEITVNADKQLNLFELHSVKAMDRVYD